MAEHIKIGGISPRIQYAGDGVQTAFIYPFPIFTDADLRVYLDDTILTLTTHYTVGGAGADTGGVVTFVATPSVGQTVTLVRSLAVKRESDFQESGEFRAKVINDELDKIIAMIQEIADTLGRGLFLSATDVAGSLTLPGLSLRQNKYLAFDSSGDPIAAAEPGGYPASTFMATILDDADAATARSTLGLGDAATGTIGIDVLSPTGDGSGLTGIVAGDAWGDPVDADIVPDTDSSRDLGSATKAFANAYLDTILPVGADTTIKRVGGTNTTPFVEGMAKTRANLNGTGTIAGRDSWNISGYTDNGTGDYTFTMTNAMANINYDVQLSCSPSYSTSVALQFIHTSGMTEATPTVSAFRCTISGSSGTPIDSKYISATAFGDLA